MRIGSRKRLMTFCRAATLSADNVGVDPDAQTGRVTELLVRWQAGQEDALEALIPLVYEELRRTARRYLRQERPDHTLQSTALVHEAFVRLVGQDLPELQNRKHFFAVAATLMRQILVDHARTHAAEKRGGDAPALQLDGAALIYNVRSRDVLALDDALNSLAVLDARQSRIVELRYFTGLSIDETAEVLGISPATVKRDWTTARAWLQREMIRSAEA
jgi:RNA polymerase sigma factor (TIGR02999 family)